MLALRRQQEPLHLTLHPVKPQRASIGAKRNPQSTRAILDAARTILERDGLAGLSMDAIARLAQCGKPTLYRWWPEKAALLAEIHEGLLLPSDTVDANLDQIAAHWLNIWRSTLAGVCLRGMIAEAQSSPAAATILGERGLEPYRRDVRMAIDANDDAHRVEESLHQTLFPLIGRLLLGSDVAIAPRVNRTEPAVSVTKPRVVAQASSDSASVRHRGEWVD